MVRSFAKIVLVVSILLVAVPSIQAAETQAETRSLMSWSFLADLWEIFSTAWWDNGCLVDPSGCPRG